MSKIVIGGSELVDHQFWEKYYRLHPPTSFSGEFTNQIEVKREKKQHGYHMFKPDGVINGKKTRTDLSKMCKLGGERPSLRYYFNNLTVEKVTGNHNQSCLSQVDKMIRESIVEPELDEKSIPKKVDYIKEVIEIPPKKKVKKATFLFNMNFPQKKEYEKKYSKHYPIVMADSIYIKEINTRFILDRKTEWYEPKIKYSF